MALEVQGPPGLLHELVQGLVLGMNRDPAIVTPVNDRVLTHWQEGDRNDPKPAVVLREDM